MDSHWHNTAQQILPDNGGVGGGSRDDRGAEEDESRDRFLLGLLDRSTSAPAPSETTFDVDGGGNGRGGGTSVSKKVMNVQHRTLSSDRSRSLSCTYPFDDAIYATTNYKPSNLSFSGALRDESRRCGGGNLLSPQETWQ